MTQEGSILKGINNIYTVADEHGREYLCRIKGKVLRGIDVDKTPLTPADRVLFEPVGLQEGRIEERLDRKNSFVRYNLKRRMNQTLFVNVDQILCVVSVDQPQFRPGFIDRVLLCADDIPVVIVLNKTDLPEPEDISRDIEVYASLGIGFCRVSAAEGKGLDELAKLLPGKRSALFGQSGAGKSSLVNALIPAAEQRTEEVSLRYNKGRHTTNFTTVLKSQDGNWELLDTPGVREIDIPDMDPSMISHWYPDMKNHIGRCRFSPCLHIHEPGCAVKNAVEDGEIDAGRYQRYVRITEEQKQRSSLR